MRFSIVVVLVVALAFVASPAQAQFETRTVVDAPQSPNSIAVGDFNRDGKMDIAVACYPEAGNGIVVLLGKGDGTFGAPSYLSAGLNPGSVVTADLNKDGALDLVVAAANGLYVLLGNGDGTFQNATHYTIPNLPSFVAVGDFNGDQNPDLVIVAYPTVGVMLGNGDGTFQSPLSFKPTFGATALGVGDFDRDGKLDLVVGEDTNPAQIFLGNGDGTFRINSSFEFETEPPTSIAVGDFRGNGTLDLAVGTETGELEVLLGNGDGTFQAAVNYESPYGSYWVTAADLNGDGMVDLAATGLGLGSPLMTAASVYLGNGDGTFQTPTNYPSGGESRFIGVGDFNGDKKLDLVTTDSLNNDVVVLLNTGVVSFAPTTALVFPPQLLGTSSTQRTVTLTNTGTATLAIVSIRVQGQFEESNTCGTSVAAGAKCAINVRSAPTTQGTLVGTVSIRDSASSKPQVIELSGAGTVVEFEPASLNFSPQTVGTTSAPQKVQLTNTGSAELSISNVYVEGQNWTSFAQTNNCGSSIAPGGMCTFSVTFDPVQKGALRALLNVYDSGGGTFQSVTLTGSGD